MPELSFFPHVSLKPDIFGLRHVTIAGQACENEQDMRKRVDAVEKGIAAAFRAAVSHLGEEEARLLFAQVVRRPKRGQGKMLAPDRDARLLKEFDAVVLTGETVAALARRLRADGLELGNTEGAIATQIRKLVKERKKREHAAAVNSRRLRMAMRKQPPTILSAAMNKK